MNAYSLLPDYPCPVKFCNSRTSIRGKNCAGCESMGARGERASGVRPRGAGGAVALWWIAVVFLALLAMVGRAGGGDATPERMRVKSKQEGGMAYTYVVFEWKTHAGGYLPKFSAGSFMPVDREGDRGIEKIHGPYPTIQEASRESERMNQEYKNKKETKPWTN